MSTRWRRPPALVVAAGVTLLGLVLLPAASAAPTTAAQRLPEAWKATLSRAALTQYYLAHPDQAPADMRNLVSARQRAETAQRSPASVQPGPMASSVFNHDDTGLPQVEESVNQCTRRPSVVLEGTNDDRGFLDPEGDIGGWHLSTNGGRSLANEGRLPATVFPSGRPVPSGGDPVAASDGACNLYLANLSLGFSPAGYDSGLAVYRSTPDTLANCPGGTDPTCWPTRVAVASTADPNVLLDKPWMSVGSSAGRTVVWVTYTEFFFDPVTFQTGSRIKAVRCTPALDLCSEPETISDPDQNTQFSYVTVGPDGRTYVTWVEILGVGPGLPETFAIKLRVAPPGSLAFGPTRLVTTEQRPIPFGGFLNADAFRIATLPKSDVKMVGGRPRVYVVWESCAARPVGVVCEHAQVKIVFSDSFGEGWSEVKTLSGAGNSYFATISADPGAPTLAVAWWTSRFDPTFDNRQDVELATVSVDGTVHRLQRLTSVSNEPEADPFLGPTFIGDYIQVFARNGQALVGFNANYRRETLTLDAGLPVPQEDNYLVAATL